MPSFRQTINRVSTSYYTLPGITDRPNLATTVPACAMESAADNTVASAFSSMGTRVRLTPTGCDSSTTALAPGGNSRETAPVAINPGDTEPVVILINGVPSSGKTCNARAIQHLAAIPLLRVGIDDLFPACPKLSTAA